MLPTDGIPESEFSENVIESADAWLAAVAQASSSHQERRKAWHVPHVVKAPMLATSKSLNLAMKTPDDTSLVSPTCQVGGIQKSSMTTRSASKVNSIM